MKNKFGRKGDLKLYNKYGVLIYKYTTNSKGISTEITYDKNRRILTYRTSNGFSSEYTRDEEGKALTYKNSHGEREGFDIPEFTMEQLVEKIGNFKLIK
jgi:YD repeat-containing protein